MTRLLSTANHQMSLFYTLLGSFIAIILLLVSIHSFAYTFFRHNLKNEIILNSSLNLDATAANYEKHIKLIRSFMLGYLFDNDTEILRRGNPMNRYNVVVNVQKELGHKLNNTLLYVNNIIYYFPDDDFVIERDGTRTAETMFSKFYASPAYGAEFWDREMESDASFKIYPAATFSSDTAFERHPLGLFLPILVKNAFDHRFAFIVLLNGEETYEAFHQSKPDSGFYILGPDREVLFSSSDRFPLPKTIAAKTGVGYVRADDNYYFYRTAPETGFTYFEVVSNAGLAAQIHRLNLIIGALLAISLLIGLAVSYYFSRRFHNPLANMIRSVQSLNAMGGPAGRGSRIKEFNLLHSVLSDLSRSNREYHEDLQAKNTLLQQFAYMTKLKKIHISGTPLQAALNADEPYRFALTQIDFKGRFATEITNTPHRALNTYKELIDAHFSGLYEDSLTFQLEKDQILTILFDKSGSEGAQFEGLDALARLLREDSVYCNFTIAVSPVRHNSADFAETYQNVLDLIKQRRLGEDVQIIAEWRPQPALMIPSPSEENELTANLQSGCDDVTIPLVDQLLDQLAKAGAMARQFQDFAKEIVNKTLKIMYAQNISIHSFTEGGSPYDQLRACHTLEQYKAFFHRFLSRSAAAVQAKRSETDVMTKFVMEYVEANYGSDLSLDAIAGKLGITGPYLSTYFKEKTGTNFSDYILTVRMNKATEMLRETDLKIQEIASLVGYYTVASFNRVFKRFTGITPSEFRRHHNRLKE
ncbi:helix-turn-helix domain-containing protein [Cohnella zeiphila]|uniref:Helix-turn-helix transcriptional regulator n=1 Tax=Cohnella zeiphila TaxID=2761120 RepID=A0A7X0SH75_9BACL|nr:AraC family transcriptional regulator [Cohnella zeiphila]MBB6729927.1 helix-turn-helix transcriptional regulator [Cohnella zeiphila]